MPNCPYCEEVLSFCDHVLRHEKQAGGKKQWYLIERWKCNKCPTKKLHRALPDFLAPYKHYSVDIIADILDDTYNTSEEGYEDYEDYPCDKTKERWKAWIEMNRTAINGNLKSVGTRLLALGIALVYSVTDLIEELRKRERLLWLRIIIRGLYNTGSSLEPFRDGSG